MKIIATSIVVLAAASTVSAGESNLRLGRDLKNKGGNRPNGNGMGYGNRCCKERDDCYLAPGPLDADQEVCDVSNINNPSRLEKFLAGFPGCDVNDDGDCDAIDDRRRDLKKGNRPINAKAMGYGRRCCRGFDEGTGEGQCESDLTYDEACDYLDIPVGPRLDKFIEGFNAGGCVWNTDLDSDGEPEGCEFAGADE